MAANSSELMPIDQALTLKEPFTEYHRFEDNGTTRPVVRKDFVENREYLPDYQYPKIATLYDEKADGSNSVISKKTNLRSAIYSLEAAAASGDIDPGLKELMAGYYENRLQKIMMTEAAKDVLTAGTADKRFVAEEGFMSLNHEIYGRMDEASWLGIMTTEKRKVDNFKPVDTNATIIVDQLRNYFSGFDTSFEEQKLVDQELVDLYKPFIEARYAHVFNAIPDTGDLIYDASECANIMNEALKAGGFDDWCAEVKPGAANPSTSTFGKKISLPPDTRRTSDEIRRLVIHEQEVHARRGKNGSSHEDLPILAYGTQNYADVEEGLGVVLEVILSGTTDGAPAVDRARQRYITAGLIEGIDSGKPRDARETYEILWRLIAIDNSEDGVINDTDVKDAKAAAEKHIDNAFRGTRFSAKGVYYTKLKIYHEGLAKNAAYLRSINGDPELFDQMFVGKYDHTDAKERNMVLQLIAAQGESNG